MKVHVIGAGVAGLAAAVKLAQRGVTVELSEAAAQAGGRCRSYFDPQLGQVIDNGNHLVLSGNTAIMAYLDAIGARDRLAGPERAEFVWADVRTGKRWTLRPNEGPIPWWVFSPSRRVPDTRVGDYLGLVPLTRPQPGKRVDQAMRCEGVLWERLMEPFLLAALNTEAKSGSADLAGAVVRETLAKGGAAYRPRIAEPTLAAAFVDPAITTLESAGATVRLGRRLRKLEMAEDRITGLTFADGEVTVGAGETVVLAVPPWVAGELVPRLTVPTEHRAIVNAHFRVTPPSNAEPMIGVIGGTVEWIFAFPERISVTVSGADRLVDMDREALARLLWKDVAAVHGLSQDLPPWQVVKEKRATFAATPEQDALRPPAKTRWSNLILAGDWTATGLPATIEGAVRSGGHAADLALARLVV
ncbi:hydroxysqualene dehydroxylase HpnE [Caulobacter sp. S45]|uniref:hydroxysqualene dehydroxylase HpnE n=1 Tax=Caulobacter sp. S45 TaxID=1641861 RepID=UPI00131C2C41|nr:hydroxysqualene dehydroxylase HpnE [Caulobacter sp. S45]